MAALLLAPSQPQGAGARSQGPPASPALAGVPRLCPAPPNLTAAVLPTPPPAPAQEESAHDQLIGASARVIKHSCPPPGWETLQRPPLGQRPQPSQYVPVHPSTGPVGPSHIGLKTPPASPIKHPPPSPRLTRHVPRLWAASEPHRSLLLGNGDARHEKGCRNTRELPQKESKAGKGGS